MGENSICHLVVGVVADALEHEFERCGFFLDERVSGTTHFGTDEVVLFDVRF